MVCQRMKFLGVLSLDNHVLSDFKLRSPRSPNVNSLPFIIWSRLYFDLESYVTERKLRDSSLITFYHSQFSEVIKNEYLTSQNERLYRLNLAKFFELEISLNVKLMKFHGNYITQKTGITSKIALLK